MSLKDTKYKSIKKQIVKSSLKKKGSMQLENQMYSRKYQKQRMSVIIQNELENHFDQKIIVK